MFDCVVTVVSSFMCSQCKKSVTTTAPDLHHCKDTSVDNYLCTLLGAVCQGMDNVNKNVFLEYVMMNSVFETLMQVGLALC